MNKIINIRLCKYVFKNVTTIITRFIFLDNIRMPLLWQVAPLSVYRKVG